MPEIFRRAGLWQVGLVLVFLCGSMKQPQAGPAVFLFPGLLADPGSTAADLLAEYEAILIPGSDEWKTYQELRTAGIVLKLEAERTEQDGLPGMTGTKDGKTLKIIIHLPPVRSRRPMNLLGVLAHELEHARQFLRGEIAFVTSDHGKSWHAAFYDAADELRAFQAQLRIIARCAPGQNHNLILNKLSKLSPEDQLAFLSQLYGLNSKAINMPGSGYVPPEQGRNGDNSCRHKPAWQLFSGRSEPAAATVLPEPD